jgi:rhodanese-related sulfurtransferase
MKNIFCVVLVCIIITSCHSQKAKETSATTSNVAKIEVVHQDVSVAVAKKMVNSPNASVIAIDVRTKAEIESGMIPNALHIDYNAPDFRSKIDKLDRNKSYLVYCHAGGRSKGAARIMKEMGFHSVHNLADGYRAWNE